MSGEQDRVPNCAFVDRGSDVTKLKTYLEEQGLGSETRLESIPEQGPRRDQPNSIICRKCGESEYRSKKWCACGAYLQGQIEDEYYEWRRSWEKFLNQKSVEAANRSRIISMISMGIFAPLLILYVFGLFDYIFEKISPLYCAPIIIIIFILYKISIHYDEKSKAIIREKELLTFDLYSEHILHSSDISKRQQSAENSPAER